MSSYSSHITLSHLNGIIQDTITSSFSNRSFWVVADITEHSYKDATGYHYFEFVEKNPQTNTIIAKIKGAAWGDASKKIKRFEEITGQKFTNNINVLTRVSVSFHKVFGLTLNVEEIDPNFTLGVIEAKRQETLLRLLTNFPDVIQKRGNQYFTKNKSLPLPPVISKIAVISSKTSAGNEDFKHTLINNSYGFHFEIDDYFTVVQNEANAGKLVEAIISIYNSGIKYDAVIINRGGGSQTDFLIFDNYKIGLAIAKFPIPIITGIGHQKNETISDLMAHTATKTPTKAAEYIITHNKIFADKLDDFQKSIIKSSQMYVANQNTSFERLKSRIVNTSRSLLQDNKDTLSHFRSVFISVSKDKIAENKETISKFRFSIMLKSEAILKNEKKEILAASQNLPKQVAQLLKNRRIALQSNISLIKVISPENILKKGYAIIKKDDKIISDPSKITVNSSIEIILKESLINTKVISNIEYHGTDFNLPTSL